VNRPHRILSAAVFMTLLTTAACQEDVRQPIAVPEPGALTVSIKSPNGDDGAVVLTLRGKNMGTPVALNPDHRLFILSQDSVAGELRIAVIGDHLAGALVSFDVPDTRRADAYTATVVEAADQGNAVREVLSGYAVTVARGPSSEPGERSADRDAGTIFIP
jgi:hypothetical protein